MVQSAMQSCACHTWHPMGQLLVSLALLSTPRCLHTVQASGSRLHTAGLCTRRDFGAGELHVI